VATVGVIGLGLLGSALAERFLHAGFAVAGFDVRHECRQHLPTLGGRPRDSASAVAEAADVVVLSLPDSAVVAAVVEEIAGRLPGKLVLDTTTGDPEATAELGRRLSGQGVAYVDATVAGSSRQARAGAVVVMAGGEADAVRRAEPYLRAFAERWFHLGPWGSGARAKLVVNLVLGLNRAVLAEGLAFARRCGLEPATTLELLRSGAAYSRAMDVKGRKMIEGDFTPEARLSQHLKDVRLILAAGRRVEAVLPFSELHERLLAELAEEYGEADNSAVLRAFQARE
jgi:3-hydroxyisobutyrate dehydrogenase-like beta-hydroxyacid dehydrogenase